MLLGILLGVSLAVVVSSLALLALGLGGSLTKISVTGAVIESSPAFTEVSGLILSLLVLSLISTVFLLRSLRKHRSIFEQHF